MYIRANRNSGQSTLEYAFVIAVIVGALIAMQIYIKRSMEGKMKSTSDEIGEGYSARNSRYVNDSLSISDSSENIDAGKDAAAWTAGITSTQVSSKSTMASQEKVENYKKEYQD